MPYKRRKTHTVHVGTLTIGGDSPIRLQSMATVDTNDINGCVAQAKRIIDAGAELVRFTTQGRREALALGEIRRRLRQEGYTAPLVADVHFNADVADVAATQCEKVRINPGNYVDPARTFKHLEYTDEEYAAELKRLDERLVKFINICKDNHTAVRVGVNHGSLSDRIMSRYGDTPEGIVESCMEFLRIFSREGFADVVVSIKASNTVVMVKTVRMLVAAMESENMDYPLHLGVTEAGDGEDGRLKSAVGIGALLTEGIGDTIRVSLSEEPEAELPVARCIVENIVSSRELQDMSETITRERLRELSFMVIDRAGYFPDDTCLQIHLHDKDFDRYIIRVAMIASRPLFTGRVKNLRLFEGKGVSMPKVKRREEVADAILQAARVKFTKTEYISCPGCGRTLYDLQDTIRRVKAATAHLVGLKIGIMGCIVNGPGEMADADYGYVGAGRGKISLYRGKECVEKNIPEADAVEHLLSLIESDRKKNA